VSRAADAENRLLVFPDCDGERLDIFLASTTNLSRRAARRLISDGLVQRNGQVLRVQSRTVITGDVIDVVGPRLDLGIANSPPAAIDILHEDGWLLIASKPAGVLSQPAEGPATGDTLAFDQQVLLAIAWRDGSSPFLRMVHRLDRVTSGAILFARSPDALPELSRCWRKGGVERFYLAVVEGHPQSDAFSIDRPIARDPEHRWRFRAHDAGKPARTTVEVLERLDDGLTVVGCRLVTGRTHQVRVHLSSFGNPVLGDRLYGSTRAHMAGRPLLHAASLGFPHPSYGDRLQVQCPPPPDIAEFLPEGLGLANL
jgi:23S rRNA pseudouridine1911/1915/1917 synthase